MKYISLKSMLFKISLRFNSQTQAKSHLLMAVAYVLEYPRVGMIVRTLTAHFAEKHLQEFFNGKENLANSKCGQQSPAYQEILVFSAY